MDTTLIADTYRDLCKKEYFNKCYQNEELYKYFQAQRHLLENMYPDLMDDFNWIREESEKDAEKDFKFYGCYQ